MFTPPAQFNVIDFLFNRGGMPLTISLESVPWNKIRPKNYLSLRISVDPLWQDSFNLSCTIPLGPAQWSYAYLYVCCILH